MRFSSLRTRITAFLGESIITETADLVEDRRLANDDQKKFCIFSIKMKQNTSNDTCVSYSFITGLKYFSLLLTCVVDTRFERSPVHGIVCYAITTPSANHLVNNSDCMPKIPFPGPWLSTVAESESCSKLHQSAMNPFIGCRHPHFLKVAAAIFTLDVEKLAASEFSGTGRPISVTLSNLMKNLVTEINVTL